MQNLAFVFPGQGSQFVGMLAELAGSYALVNDVFTLVAEKVGFDLWQLVQEGPESLLNQTKYTQVAMLAADVAIFKLLMQLGVARPNFLAGHSLGEYPALVCANALSLTDAAYLVVKRGELMQQAVPAGTGAMAAIIGLADEHVELICQQLSSSAQYISPANYNAVGQVVIAGHTEVIVKAIKVAQEQGALLAKIIPVSVSCHCLLLHEAAIKFADYLAAVNFKEPEIAVIANVDLSIYQNAAQLRALLTRQLYSPVRWVETIQLLKSKNVDFIIECGPGKVLAGLIKRIDKSITTFSVNNVKSLEQVLQLTSSR